jgi:hypothetical protein
MNNAPAPNFPGITSPSIDFGSVIDGRRATLFVYELDLTSARSLTAGTATQIKLTGNSIFIDQASDVGNATVIFEGVQDDTGPVIRPAVYVQPGFVAKIPFANLRIANSAQSGKKLRIFYGVDVDFVPSVNASVAISGNVSAVPYGAAYGASYKSTTNLAANTADAVFAAASNINGALVHGAEFISGNGGTAGYAATGFLAKTSAPTTAIDGDVILGATNWTSTVGSTGQLQQPVFIAAGKGLYFISTLAETANGVYRNVRYTLL